MSEAAQYRGLYSRLMCGGVDIGEAYLKLKAVGSVPTFEEFAAALAEIERIDHAAHAEPAS